MPHFGTRSKNNLRTCDKQLRDLFNEVIKHVDCAVIAGHRKAEEQTKAFETGKSKVKWPNSKHNSLPSKAVDVAPWHKEQPHIRWNNTTSWYHFVGFVRGVAAKMDIKIRCGADWDGDFDLKDQNFNDLPHFELVE